MTELDLTVIYLSDHGMEPSLDPQFGRVLRWDVPLLDGYRWKLAQRRRRPSSAGAFTGISTGAIDRDLRGFDAVTVCGWNYLGYLPAVLAARLQGTAVIHLSESTYEDSSRDPLKRLAKEAFFRFHLRAHDHALAVGTRSRRYLEGAGIAAANIHAYPYTIDTALTDDARPNAVPLRAEWRSTLGIESDAVVFVFSGKLIEKKNPVNAVRAFAAAVSKRHTSGPRAHFVIVGAGALEASMRAEAAGRHDVHFVGFVNQREIPGIYAASDVLVLPSLFGETWGLVVNEAMAMGCGAIVSDRVGSSEDLVRGRDTGLVVPANDVDALAEAMRAAMDDEAMRERWRANAPRVILGHTPQRAAEGVREAVLAAVRAALG